MGKEAKIGLAVILILLITFGVVLGKKLTAPDASAAAGKDKNESKEAEKEKKGRLTPPPAPAASPTVVVTKPTSSRTPHDSAATASTWDVATDAKSTGLDGTGGNGTGQPKAKQPPLSMPKPPGAVAVAPYPPYGAEQPLPGGQAGTSQVGKEPPNVGQRHNAIQNQNAQPWSAPPTQPPAAPGMPLRVGTGQPATSPPTGAYGAYHPSAHARSTWQSDPAAGTPTDSMVAQSSPHRQPSQHGGTTSKLISIPGQSSVGGATSAFDSPLPDADGRREDGTYEIQPNDSYSVISERLYGSSAYFMALAEHNRDKIPRENQLEVGDVISTPELSELEQTYPGQCPKASRRKILRNRATAVASRGAYRSGRSYKVQEGDTLFDIARYELGKASRWPEIHDLNRDVLGDDYNLLSPGLELALPDDGNSLDNMTHRPSSRESYYKR